MRPLHFWLGVGALLLGAAVIGHSQTVTTPTAGAAVCAYNATPPSVASGQFVYVQCDSSGRLKVQ